MYPLRTYAWDLKLQPKLDDKILAPLNLGIDTFSGKVNWKSVNINLLFSYKQHLKNATEELQ